MSEKENEIHAMVNKCLDELHNSQEIKYDQDKAERTAALFLSTQMHLANLLEFYELKARQSKRNVEVVEAEKYFHYKTNSSGKNSEASLAHLVAKDEAVIEAKGKAAKDESILKKWSYVMGTIKDATLYYRSMAKGKTMWE